MKLLACKKTICVSMNVGTEKLYACGSTRGLCKSVALFGCSVYVSMLLHTCGCVLFFFFFFPQAVTRTTAESLVTCVCVSLCVVFKLLFNFCFLFYSWPNPNATQLCSQPEEGKKKKRGLGGWVARSWRVQPCFATATNRWRRNGVTSAGLSSVL